MVQVSATTQPYDKCDDVMNMESLGTEFATGLRARVRFLFATVTHGMLGYRFLLL